MKKLHLLIATGTVLLASALWVGAAATNTFQQDVNGYIGTVDTQIRGGQADIEYSMDTSLSIDTSDGGGQNHVLIRFEDMFGSGPGQVPRGSVVFAVTLRLWIVSDGNPPNFHRMIVPWVPTVTWNEFDPVNLDGIQANDVEAAAAVDGSFQAPNGEPYFVEVSLSPATVQAWMDGTSTNNGWAILPTGSNGVDFHTGENTDEPTRPLLTIVTLGDGETAVQSFTSHPLRVDIVLTDGKFSNGQTNVIPASSITLNLDGANVPVEITKSGLITTVTYRPSPFFASGSTHTAILTYSESSTPPKTLTFQETFTIVDYPVVPASYAVTGVDTTKPGFKARVHQIPVQRPGGDQNNVNIAEKQLADALIDPNTGMPFVNEADLSQATNGIFEIPGVINWEQQGLVSGNFSTDSTPPVPDEFIPGIPGINLADNYIAAAITTYLELKAGFHRFGVNSDDGFRVTVGPSPHDVFATTLGLFDTGRGAGDTLFEFAVEQDGIYPVRLSWWEGTGGASLEFFSVDIATGAKTLINDSSNPNAIKAFREGPTDVFGPRPGLQTLVAVDDQRTWRYDEFGNDLGTAWKETNFDDSAWLFGFALLGFEGGQIADTLRQDITPGFITYYFRTRFNFDGDPAQTELRLRHIVDDGVIFYLNGVEVHRFRVPAGPVLFDTSGQGHENEIEGPFAIPTASLVRGTNVLAAEVHQDGAGSSDMIFGAELFARPAPQQVTPPRFTAITRSPGGVVLEWTGGGALQAAAAVTGPWNNVAGASSPHNVTPTEPARFYRVQR